MEKLIIMMAALEKLFLLVTVFALGLIKIKYFPNMFIGVRKQIFIIFG